MRGHLTPLEKEAIEPFLVDLVTFAVGAEAETAIGATTRFSGGEVDFDVAVVREFLEARRPIELLALMRGDVDLSPELAVLGARAAAERADQDLVDLVAAQRAQGASWAEIGCLFGVTRQAAWERFSKRVGEVDRA